MKKLFFWFLGLTLTAAGLSSCEDSNDNDAPAPSVSRGAFVINQGLWGRNNASLGYIDFESGTVSNCGPLSDTPQGGVAVGQHAYVACFGSNLLKVVNMATKQVEDSIRVSAPQAVVSTQGKLYVVGADSVFCIDPSSKRITDALYVGPNPYGAVVANGFIYVTIGGTYGVFTDGNRIVKVDPHNLTPAGSKEISVGTNPYNQMAADASGNVFVVCSGNYSDIPSTVYRISPADVATAFCPGTYIAAKDHTLFVVHSTYEGSRPAVSYATCSTLSATADTRPFGTGSMPTNPSFITVNPHSGHVFVGHTDAGYDAEGGIHEYSAEGVLLNSYKAGYNPFALIFE